MAITINTLGISNTVRAIVGNVASTTVYVFSLSLPTNSFDDPPLPQLVLTAPAFGFKQSSQSQQQLLIGPQENADYQITIATPSPDLTLLPGWYAVIYFSGGNQIVTGTLERIDRRISSLIKLHINTKEPVPYSTAELGLNF
jgi:hypothetical protein